MIVIIIGIAVGIATAFFTPIVIPPNYSVYVATAILAALDSILGGLTAMLNKNFDSMIFITGLFGNAALAAFIIFLGEKLGLDLYLAVVVVFGTRFFQNFAVIRRFLINKYSLRKEEKQKN